MTIRGTMGVRGVQKGRRIGWRKTEFGTQGKPNKKKFHKQDVNDGFLCSAPSLKSVRDAREEREDQTCWCLVTGKKNEGKGKTLNLFILLSRGRRLRRSRPTPESHVSLVFQFL